jgi:L-alanine-DL-glutamate epimerase-like enolase superfamily enzyme
MFRRGEFLQQAVHIVIPNPGSLGRGSRFQRLHARWIGVHLCLLVLFSGSPVSADKHPRTAVELLTAYSGQSAVQYEEAFEFSVEWRITRIDLHAVGTDLTTAQYSGREPPLKEVNTILRITTADGHEGVSGVDSYHQGGFSDELLRELQAVTGEFVRLGSLDPIVVGNALGERRPALSDAARASIDIALWDLAARKADLPLYQMIGAKRDAIEAYASLPFYETLPEYVEAVHEYAKLGFRTFKFHVWGSIEEDLELVALIQQTFAEHPYEFMVDLESVYELRDAQKLGEELDEGLFVWFEAPVDDALLSQYAMLRDRLAVKIIPAGYTYYSPAYVRQGIGQGAWDAGRFDVTTVGGISNSLELLKIANDARTPIEIQSWGHTLTQVANLHLMLANELTVYFEAPMPKDAFEFGMRNGNLLDRGRARAPGGPGLGVEVAWDTLDTADFHVHRALDHSEF